MQRQSGFTLTELVITLILVSILGITVFVSLPVGSLNLHAEKKLLISQLRYAQVLAMSRAGNVTVRFARRNYRIVNVSNYSVIGARHDLASSVRLNWNRTIVPRRLTFDKTGTPTVGGTPLTQALQLTLSSGGESQSISVTPSTGSIIG